MQCNCIYTFKGTVSKNNLAWRVSYAMTGKVEGINVREYGLGKCYNPLWTGALFLCRSRDLTLNAMRHLRGQ